MRMNTDAIQKKRSLHVLRHVYTYLQNSERACMHAHVYVHSYALLNTNMLSQHRVCVQLAVCMTVHIHVCVAI
jgi:hypothetical protein